MATWASGQRALEAEAPVGPVGVVVVDELSEECVEVTLVDDDHVVQTLPPYRAHCALGDGVRLWRAGSSLDRGDPEARCPVPEVLAIGGIAVVDEVLRPAAPWRRLDQLAPDPSGRGAARHVEVDDLPAVVGDEEEDVEGPIGDRLDDEEVRSPDPLDLIGKKRSPAGSLAALASPTDSGGWSAC